MTPESHTLKAPDGHDIHLRLWLPPGPATHVVQVVHGLGEHAGRYEGFAAAANARGIAVAAHDHRGHGEHADPRGYLGARGGWGSLIGDTHAVHQWLEDRFEGLPLVVLGHSMGSFIAQAWLIRHNPRLAGVILSGSTWPSRSLLLAGALIGRIETWRVAPHGNSPVLNRMGIGKFNRPFRPARTPYDWLSSDEAEVDRYIADPNTGGPYSAGLWAELARGLLEISTDAALQRIAADLPVLITGGEEDPVGGDKGMSKLAMHYAQTGHQRLKVRIYPGGRHEMLNEREREHVMSDWLDWILTTSRSGR